MDNPASDGARRPADALHGIAPGDQWHLRAHVNRYAAKSRARRDPDPDSLPHDSAAGRIRTLRPRTLAQARAGPDRQVGDGEPDRHRRGARAIPRAIPRGWRRRRRLKPRPHLLAGKSLRKKCDLAPTAATATWWLANRKCPGKRRCKNDPK